MSKIFLSVSQVAEELGISESYAYKLVQRMNKELKAAGYYTIQGKVDRKYFHEKFYATSKMEEEMEKENVNL